MSKICPHCGKETTLRIANPELYKKRKIENARNSIIKAKSNGTKMGRPKVRDDQVIAELRRQGKSIRAIAAIVGTSSSTVFQSLKGK